MFKKLSLSFLLVLLFSTLSSAQTLTLIVEWDANPAADAVLTYTVTLTAQSSSTQTIPASACNVSTGKCQATFTQMGQGNYTASVIATNEWAAGPAGTGQITITFPGQVKNVKGRKG